MSCCLHSIWQVTKEGSPFVISKLLTIPLISWQEIPVAPLMCSGGLSIIIIMKVWRLYLVRTRHQFVIGCDALLVKNVVHREHGDIVYIVVCFSWK